jgi:hypothetical protein
MPEFTDDVPKEEWCGRILLYRVILARAYFVCGFLKFRAGRSYVGSNFGGQLSLRFPLSDVAGGGGGFHAAVCSRPTVGHANSRTPAVFKITAYGDCPVPYPPPPPHRLARVLGWHAGLMISMLSSWPSLRVHEQRRRFAHGCRHMARDAVNVAVT